MRVNSYYIYEDGSTFYRLKEPARALKEQGFDIEFLEARPDGRDADVLVFSRPQSASQVMVIKSLSENGYGIVIDIDDNFAAIRPEHALFDNAALVDYYIREACKYASVITCSTQAIANEYGGVVIPNYVPQSYLSIERNCVHQGIWVGWSGSVASHPNDLQTTEGQVARAVVENAARVAFIGPKPKFVQFCLQYKKPLVEFGWKSLDDFPYAVAEFDIGIVPLEKCLFNESKSWLKGLEYAALGVPFVAASTRPYRDLQAGDIARSPSEWYSKLTALIQNADIREEQAGRNRARASRLTIEQNCDQWAHVFELAATHRTVKV